MFEMTGIQPQTGAPRPDRRWRLLKEGGIVWDVAADSRLPHEDHVEMSGRFVSVIVRYGIGSDGSAVVSKHVVWPNLRIKPNDTHGSLSKDYAADIVPHISLNGKRLDAGKVRRIVFDGLLTIWSDASGILIARTIFPAAAQRAVLETWTLTNVSPDEADLQIEPLLREEQTNPAGDVDGPYVLTVESDAPARIHLVPGAEFTFGVRTSGRKKREAPLRIAVSGEEEKRRAFVHQLDGALRLETPDPILNRAFDFAKLRAAESIFQTKNGLMHSPGGGPYYAALWCNDQAEYSGPFFPFLGDDGGNEAALNCYRLFAGYMQPDYRPIPSSIVAEGDDIWAGAGDRGDAAMYAYGAARYALARGDREIAEELWTPILWSLEYCRRHMTAEGVIASDSDELEGRFPSGKANLSTSSLAYGGLRSAADLARSLGKPQAVIADLDSRADALAHAIEVYFGADVEGYGTYRYYDGNTVLRSWICLPLTMGIMDRKEDTVQALFSPRLWTQDGLATQAGDKTFWDRSTLYGFRGVFAAGETEKALDYLTAYTDRRLLGEHVPYAVEASPEGNQRHLSAESALYCLVYIEGLFGIIPTGLNSFRCQPHLPENWDHMALRAVKAFGRDFDLSVRRQGARQEIEIRMGTQTVFQATCKPGECITVDMP